MSRILSESGPAWRYAPWNAHRLCMNNTNPFGGNNQNVGLLLVERVINMPPQYVPMLHTELPADLAFTKKEEDIKDPREFNYTHMLVVSKYTVPV